MDLRRQYLTKNRCYTTGKSANQIGIVVHSTGANNPNIKRYVQPDDGKLGNNTNNNSWNNSTISKCVHAFIGYDKDKNICTYETLPYEYACWGCGGGTTGKSYNYNPQAHIQFEICEDGLTDGTYFNKVMKEAQEYCAYLCIKFDINPNDIVDHATAYKQGYASNHSDIGNWLSKFNKDLAWFRKCVIEAINQTLELGFSSYKVKIVNVDSKLNVRDWYTSNANIESKLENGDIVEVDAEYNNRLRIKGSGYYIYKKYTEVYTENEDTAETQNNGTTTNETTETTDNTTEQETTQEDTSNETTEPIEDTTEQNETENDNTDEYDLQTNTKGTIITAIGGGLVLLMAWLKEYWYWILLGIVIIAVLVYIIKKKGKK